VHFDRWMEIFTETLDQLYTGATADEANYAPKNMADMFNYKINYFRDTDQKDLLNSK
jgi:hemoglobin